MAKVTGAATTYGGSTNREDLSNTIYNIDPADTPIVSAIGRRKISNRSFDWSIDSLPSPDTTADIEGSDLAASSLTLPSKSTNVTQIKHRDATVSGSQEAVDMAGAGKGTMSFALARASKALKADVERVIGSSQARVDGDDSSPTARKTRGLLHYVQSNASVGSGYTAPSSAAVAQTNGTVRTFTEGLLQDALELAFNNGGTPNLAVMGSHAKRKFSGFAGRSNSRVRGDADTILGAADYYLSDWGEIKAVPSRSFSTRDVLVIDPDYAKMAYLRPFFMRDMPIKGDAECKAIFVEFGLEVSNEKAHAKVADLDVAT
jgi:hypothetical protein